MLDSVFSSVLAGVESAAVDISATGFSACCVASLVLGAAVACIYMFRHTYSKNFVVTLALLPVIVQMVIMLVNGNIGAGIAVMGVFNLVRFRSIPGSAKDIGSVFWPWRSVWPRAWDSSGLPSCSLQWWLWRIWFTCCLRSEGKPASTRRCASSCPKTSNTRALSTAFSRVLHPNTSS